MALIAVLTVNVGGAHLGAAPKPVHHPIVVTKMIPDAATDPVGTDAFTMRGSTHFTYFPPPPPDPVPAEDPAANSPLAQLPVAAPQAPQAPAAPRPAPPAIVVGSTQQAYINGDRAAAGLGQLTWSSCLAGIAYQNAVRMANAGGISHAGGASADLGCGLGQQGGENVGYWSAGINDPQLNTMFMNSPGHRANIMGPYHYVGTSWVVGRNGAGYIAVEFS
ncbi:MAG: CAP domain-containing protein [Candidatus Dormibacter sp.]